jgi:hypothetical protein
MVAGIETCVVTLVVHSLGGSTDVTNRNASANSVSVDEPRSARNASRVSHTAIHIPRDVLTTARLRRLPCGAACELCYLCAHLYVSRGHGHVGASHW